MKKVLLLFVAGILSLSVSGQVFPDEHRRRAPQSAPQKLPAPKTVWDSTRVYPQIVVLLEFSDLSFSMSDPRAYYDSVLNAPGFNSGAGPGCAAEYMLAQSRGLFHVRFDVYGPYRMSTAAQRDEQADKHGITEKGEALDSLFAAYPDMDYTPYDWDGNSAIEQVIYICAGPSANEGYTGYIWANTSSQPYNKRTPDSLLVSQHSITSESPNVKAPGGLGGFATLLHEYSHALGLTDVYPVAGKNVDLYSVVDMWDLMDGGNYIDYGWCPPNYSAFERMYMNWLRPVELDADTTITGLRPVEEGGEAYLIRHTENEYLLLENRQQTGWDYAVPGKGLTIWHVDFDSVIWKKNQVNNESLRLCLYHADNMNYQAWRAYYSAHSSTIKAYALSPRMRCCLLSTTPYPWSTDSTTWVNDQLTEESVPAIAMYHENAQGDTMLGKRITNIQMAEDGSISFTLEVDKTEGFDNIDADESTVRKILRDGVLYLIREEKVYSITGTRVK